MLQGQIGHKGNRAHAWWTDKAQASGAGPSHGRWTSCERYL